jgi:hypothetical protein
LQAFPLWETAQRKLRGRVGRHRWPAVQGAMAILADDQSVES